MINRGVWPTLGLAACLIVASVLVHAGGAAGDVHGLNAAKSFRRYPVYWAGIEAVGLPLESIDDYSAFEHNAPSGWSFAYGSCEPVGSDHPSCSLPLDIQVSSACKRWAGELNEKGDLFQFRGAKAVWRPGLPVKGGGEVEAGPLEIFTERTTIVIYSGQSKARAFAVARLLRTVHQSHPQPLPPPATGALWGKLPCQQPGAGKPS